MMGLVSADYGSGLGLLHEKVHAVHEWGRRGVERVNRASRRWAAASIGVAMFVSVFLLEPSWSRRIFAAGSVCFLGFAVFVPDPKAPMTAEDGDSELLAIVHDRLAAYDERVCNRLDRIVAEMEEL